MGTPRERGPGTQIQWATCLEYCSREESRVLIRARAIVTLTGVDEAPRPRNACGGLAR